MKVCSLCGNEKDIKEFDKNKSKCDGLQSQCKLCRKPSTIKYYETHKEDQKNRVQKINLKNKNEIEQYIIKYLEQHPCVDCNEKDIIVLEFDHLKDKKNNIGSMMRSSFTAVKEEIEKCEVRCANCHRRKTAKIGNHYRYKYIVGE